MICYCAPRRAATAASVLAAVLLAVVFSTMPPRAAAQQAEEGIVPPAAADLFPYLQSGEYRQFAHESGVHPSNGPHGNVRTYVNPILEESLKAGNEVHPVNAAAVKELYTAGGTLIGWAVSVKTAEESDEGRGWYWYEVFSTTQNRPIANGKGVALCTGCHAGGRDFVTVPYPLQ
jgi:hypothetical protein